jgi:hypothetical protein
MDKNIRWLGLVAGLLMAPSSYAQAPAGAPAIPGAPAAAPAAPSNMWSKLCLTPDQKASIKSCFCNTPIGQLLMGAAGPMSAMTGGLMGSCCARTKIADDLKKPADDPAGAAARIKADEADAKARREAVRFLGTVDCNYWPEAIDTLKTALRKDRNECVRFEAALALRNGCCCNNETIDALKNSVLGENKTDPFPVERSDRVRAVAAEALAHCPIISNESRKDDKIVKADVNRNVDPAEYYKKVADAPREDVVASARAVLASLQKGKAPIADSGTAAPPAPQAVTPRNNSVSGIVASAFAPGPNGTRQPFFTGLTKTLTGAQDGVGTVRQETVAPPINSTFTPMNTPMFTPTTKPIDPPREFKPMTPLEAPRPHNITKAPREAAIEPTLPTGVSMQPLPSHVDSYEPTTPSRIVHTPMGTLMPAPTPAHEIGPQVGIVTPVRDTSTDQPRIANAPMLIQVSGPAQTVLGKPAVFDVHVANQTSQPLTKINLYGWLPEGLYHPEGHDIKSEIDATIAPGEVKTLRIPTSAVKLGRGTVRVKVETSAGEAWATVDINIAPAALRGPMPMDPGHSGLGQPSESSRTLEIIEHAPVTTPLGTIGAPVRR